MRSRWLQGELQAMAFQNEIENLYKIKKHQTITLFVGFNIFETKFLIKKL
jgi:hypothetical protein